MADNRTVLSKELPLTGKLITSVDASTIGNNFQSLKNLRYTDTGLRGVGGMSVINSTAITTYTDIRSGIHFINEHASTPTSHIIVQAFNGGDATDSAIYENRTAIPSTGDFQATTLSSNAANSNIGNFSLGPDGTVIYCDSESSQIWGGPEARCAGFINYSDDTAATEFSYDFSDVIVNAKTDSGNIATLKPDDGGSPQTAIYIGSVRPIQSIKFYVGIANTTAATILVQYWDGTTWQNVSNLTDGTFTGTETMSQTGILAFDSTVTTAKTKPIDSIVLYWYKVISNTGIDATTAVTKCTVNAPMQQVKDLWDGEYRTAFSMIYHKGSTYEEYNKNVLEEDYSSGNTATYMQVGSLLTSDSIRPGFNERMTGMYIKMVDGFLNTHVSGLTIAVDYWNGAGWTAVSGLVDGTQGTGDDMLHASGVVSWTAPVSELEFKRNLTGVPYFYYRIKTPANFTTADIRIDFIGGIKAVDTISNYKFSVHAHNRICLCNDVDGNKNEALIGSTDASSIFNGIDSSKELFGDSSALTAGIGLYRQFGSQLYNMFVFTKATQTWVLVGQDPENWIKYQASDNIGCVAPKTMIEAHIGEVLPSQNRYVAIWQGADGIYLFDGATLRPIHRDIDDRFDQRNSNAINLTYIEDSFAHFDHINQEYHWNFAAGTAILPNTELVYDVKRDRWYEINRGTGEDLLSAFEVKDTNGNRYTYGAEDDGKVYRLENGNDFDGNSINHEFHTGDIALHEDSINALTSVRRVKLVGVAKTTTSNEVAITHYGDGQTSGTSLTSVSQAKTGFRIYNVPKGTNTGAYTFHSFKFTMSTNDEPIGFEPTFVGILYKNRGWDVN